MDTKSKAGPAAMMISSEAGTIKHPAAIQISKILK
jgi:hypothetical protein